jgi:hypothetical protein
MSSCLLIYDDVPELPAEINREISERDAGGLVHRQKYLPTKRSSQRLTSALLHLAICFSGIRQRKRITGQPEETISSFRWLA